MSRRVAVLVGSLRKQSFNKKLADALTALAPSGLALEQVEIGDLPLYNQDLDTDAPPPSWTRFREAVKGADAVLFVTPEYNRSMTGALKNAIDVGSRPWGKSVWGGKPAAVITASPGALGGYGANHHVRQSLAALNVPLLPSPELYLNGIGEAFDEQGALKDGKLKDLVSGALGKFADWIEKHA